MELKDGYLFYFKYVTLLRSTLSTFCLCFDSAHNARTPPGDNLQSWSSSSAWHWCNALPFDLRTRLSSSHCFLFWQFWSWNCLWQIPMTNKMTLWCCRKSSTVFWKTSWKAHRVEATTLEDCCCSRDSWQEVTLVFGLNDTHHTFKQQRKSHLWTCPVKSINTLFCG